MVFAPFELASWHSPALNLLGNLPLQRYDRHFTHYRNDTRHSHRYVVIERRQRMCIVALVGKHVY